MPNDTNVNAKTQWQLRLISTIGFEVIVVVDKSTFPNATQYFSLPNAKEK